MPLKDPEERRRYQREWKARRRVEWFADKECAHCGSKEELRLDHVDPLQKVSHRIWSWSKERRETELAKCQVLCQPCHAKKTCDGNENARGLQMPNAKLTEALVLEIRERVAAGEKKRPLARELGVSEKLVRLVCLGISWGHVGSDPGGMRSLS